MDSVYTIIKKEGERQNKLYFGEGGDLNASLGVYLLKMLTGKANLKRKLGLVYTAMLESELVFLPHRGLLDRLMQGLS